MDPATSEEHVASASRPPAALIIGKGLFAVVCWGASFIATKLALRELTPGSIIWLRFGIGTAVLALFAMARREDTRISLRELAVFAILGFIGIPFHQWLQVNGLVTAQAATSAWIVSSVPIFIAMLGWLLLKETLGLFRVAGIVLAACGVLLVVSRGDPAALLGMKAETTGDLLVLLSAVNWAVFTVLSRRMLRRRSPAVAMLYVIGTGWLISTVLLPAPSAFVEAIAHASLNSWLSIAFLGFLCSGVSFIFWYDALKALPAARVGALLYLEPLVAMAVAAALLGEELLVTAYLGGALIIAGITMVNRRSS